MQIGATLMFSVIRKIIKDESGATAIEYGLIAVSYTHLTLPTNREV